MNPNFKSTVYFKLDGQSWEIEVDPFWRMENPEEFDARPVTKYFLETENYGLVECDKDKNIINMKSKDKIVERLLEEKAITAEEAVVLLKERTPIGFQQFTPNTLIGTDGKVPYHTICGCDICHCVNANKMVDPNSSGNWIIDNTFTTSENRED